ncbi:MAG: CapA family protein, partial [Actinomyces sp.]
MSVAVGVAAAAVGAGAALAFTGGGDAGSASAPVAATAGATSSTTTTATTTSTTTTTTTTTTVPPRHATLAFTGDLLPHSPVTRTAAANAAAAGRDGYDFGPMFERVRPILAGADLAICHLETPVSADDSDIRGYPVFSGPWELVAAAAEAGYDGCSTASNHSYDRGRRGVVETIEVLDRFGLGHAGTAVDEASDTAPVLYEAGGITIGHVAAAYGLNGFELPADAPWLVDLIEP